MTKELMDNSDPAMFLNDNNKLLMTFMNDMTLTYQAESGLIIALGVFWMMLVM